MTVAAITNHNRSASKAAPSTGESMPIHVKAVPAKPFGSTPRFCLQIESGYRAGERLGPYWSSQTAAETWARETGYTVLEPGARTSTTLLVDLFDTFSDFQFEDREISGADLVDALSGWLRGHKATIGRMAAPESDLAAQALKGLYKQFQPLHAGSEDVSGGDLVSDFGEWLEETQKQMPAITGAPFVAKVARHPERAEYWCERVGWGELENATAYFLSAPAGLKRSGTREWVDVELCSTLESEAEVEAEAGPQG